MKYKRFGWNGKTSLLHGTKFPTGLLSVVLDEINKWGIPYDLEDARGIKSKPFKPTTLNLRPYQLEVVEKALQNTFLGSWFPRGIIQIATGGGKTIIAGAIIQHTDVPTIFLVHRKDLAQQTIERFEEYGIDVADLDGLGTNRCVVTTIQSLMSFNTNFAAKYVDSKGNETTRTKDWLETKEYNQSRQREATVNHLNKIEQVFVDEAHLVGTDLDKINLFAQALALLPNAYLRWGLTATPFMRDELSNLVLQGYTGAEICRISNRELIDMGYATEAIIDIYETKKDPTIPKTWPDCEEFGIVLNKDRNNKIIDCLANYPGPTLVLVNKLPHGEELERLAKIQGMKIPFIRGASSKVERKQTIEDIKSGKLRGAIVSTIWDEGIDIPNLQTVILAGGGKSEIKGLQRLGRGLRLSDGKNELRLVDFRDMSPRILRTHSKIREELWRRQGFQVNVQR